MDDKKQTPYIEPNFSLAPSFEKVVANYKDRYHFTRYLNDEPEVTLRDVIQRSNLFIVAEPGQGKTRLLEELGKINLSNGGTTIYLDLKQKASDEGIESFIKRSGYKADDSKPALILLDALDEVAPRNVIRTIEYIKTYITSHSSHKVFVSCRVHFFSKYEHSFSGLAHAEFLLIEPLESRQSKQLLKSIGIDQPTIAKLFESLKFVGREDPTVLHNPRYLEMLVGYVKANPELAKKLNRADLFEAFVSSALFIEDNKNGRQLGLLKKRFLEKLALAMEIAQVNVISEDELLTFIDEAKSDVKMTLINQIEVEDLYEHSLLKKTNQEISFDNAEIQEYLAAKGILRLNDPIRCVFNVAIEPNLREPLPSWSNTLSFIIDEIPILAVKLLGIKPSIPASEDETWHRLVTGSTSPGITDEDKTTIFNRVWGYYQLHDQLISTQVSFRLANYCPTSLITPFIKNLISQKVTPTNQGRVRLINAMHIVGDIVSLEKTTLADAEKVKNKLINLSLNSKDSIIQHNAMNTLRRSYKDTDIIDRLFSLITNDDQLIQGSLQGIAYDIDKNNPKSIEIFVEGLKHGRASYSHMGIEELDNQAAISKFLDILSEDDLLIKQIIDHDSNFRKEDKKFLENISSLWLDEWLNDLKHFVIKASSIDHGYYASRSDLVKEIMKLILCKDRDYFSELLEYATKDDDMHFLYRLSQNLAAIMTENDLAPFYKVMDSSPEKQFRIFDLVLYLPFSGNPNASSIEASARKKYVELYREHDERVEKLKKENERDKATEELVAWIKKAHDNDYSVSGNALIEAMKTIERYVSDESSNKTKLNFTDEQVEFLWGKAKERILDSFDPSNTKLTIKDKDKDGTKSYTISSSTPLFELAVRFGYVTKRADLAVYRSKLIALIPYAYYGEMKAILSTLKDLSDDEKQKAIDAYRDSTSDTAQFMPDNLVEISEKLIIKQAVPILDGFVESDYLRDSIRLKAIEVSDLLEPSIKKLTAIFNKYEKSKGTDRNLSLKANELLISKHQDHSALMWRLKYVKDNPFEYVEKISEGFHTVGVFENEIHEGYIIAPLKSVGDDKYIEAYLDLLGFSFELIVRGVTWHNYASYVWAVVDQYFTNLLSLGGYGPIDRLERMVESYPNQVAASAYIRHLTAIKRSYLDTLGKPKSFASSVQKLNEINTQNYLPITSNRHLFELVSEIIEDDLNKWVIGEGCKILSEAETTAQRSILLKLENLFYRKGFSKSDVHKNEVLVLRESQALDDTRTDFHIYYGFYGPVLVELKRSDHGDLKGKVLSSKKSYKSLEQYMVQFNAEFGILLVYETQTRTNEEWHKHLAYIKSEYTKIKGVEVLGLGEPRSVTIKVKKSALRKK